MADGELGRVPEVVEPAARQHGAVLGITEGDKVVAHQPEEVRRHDNQGDRNGEVGAGRHERFAGIAIDQDEQRDRHRQDDDEIFRPER